MTKIIIKPRAPWHLIDLKDLWNFRELFYIFTWRDIKVRYKQTLLGIIWVLMQPILQTVIFTVFFGNFANIPSGNLPYPVFVLIGLIYWGFFSGALSRSANSFIENEQLVKKVYFPREILPLSNTVTAMFDFFISLAILFIFFLYYQIPLNIVFIGTMMLGIIITFLASSGLGLLLASINIKYRDVRYVVPFFLQLLIFITPVIYPLNIVRPSFQYILALNPMSGLIDALRSTLSTGIIAKPDMFAISLVSAVLIFIAGSAYFRVTERYFADVL